MRARRDLAGASPHPGTDPAGRTLSQPAVGLSRALHDRLSDLPPARTVLLSLLLALTSTVLLSCFDGYVRRPHLGIEELWLQFQSLPPKRALALAGNPDGLWVAGAAGGEATRKAAEKRALAECGNRRAELRLQVPCLLYATGGKIVWPR